MKVPQSHRPTPHASDAMSSQWHWRRSATLVAVATLLVAGCSTDSHQLRGPVAPPSRDDQAAPTMVDAQPELTNPAPSASRSAKGVPSLSITPNGTPSLDITPGGLTTYSTKASFFAATTIQDSTGFEDGNTGFGFPPDPWTTHGVTYTAGQNLTIGTNTIYHPAGEVLCNNYWTPMPGTLAGSYTALGFNLSMLGRVDPATIVVNTNLASYSYTNQTVAGARGQTFFGFVAGAGEHITSFVISSRGAGSAACLNDVYVGVQAAPVVTPVVSGTLGADGWYTSDVTIAWNVDTHGASLTSSTGCASTTLSTDTPGTTYTCSATTPGGTTTQSVTVKRDATPPTVTYSGNAGAYTIDQAVSITCSATDPVPGSGLASTTCANISGDGYTFNIGTNSYSATATDVAGNVGNGSASFTMSVTADALCHLVERWSDNAGVANSLCVKLGHGDYNPFRNEVNAQSGKHIPADKAAILLQLVNYLG